MAETPYKITPYKDSHNLSPIFAVRKDTTIYCNIPP